jgi:plastocyanin
MAISAPALACSTIAGSPPPTGIESQTPDLPNVVEIAISGFSYFPTVAVLSPGQTLRWTNFDAIEHTSTAQTGPGTLVPSGVFDTGSLNYLEFADRAAPAVGTYSYYCLPHGSSMQATVVVRGPGDVNGDRQVNFDDLLVLAANYNQPAQSFVQGDLTVDGQVNFDDLLVLAAHYNTAVAGEWSYAQVVPEPALAFGGFGVFWGLLSRRERSLRPRE